MEDKQKILLFGGTFNPIHNGHLIMAQEALRSLNFDKIILIPSAIPPHKENVLSFFHRLNMVKLAVEGVDNFKVSDIESERDRPSYTYDTVLHFKEKYPDSDVYWLIGGDTLSKLKKWYKIKELLQECYFLVAHREKISILDIHLVINEIKSNSNLNEISNFVFERFKIIKNSIIDISSTDIRDKVKNQKEEAITFLTPEKVKEYIHDNQLYTDK